MRLALFCATATGYHPGMDFTWTEEEAAFRQLLRDFLAETLPEDW